MCLTMSRNEEHDKKYIEAYKKRLKRYPYAWKIIYVCHKTPNIFSQLGYMELETNLWGKWLKSSRTNEKLTPIEKDFHQVRLGFHVFTSREAAREAAMSSLSGEKIVKVKVDPKTFVAIGRANDEGEGASSAVFDKIMYLRDQKPSFPGQRKK